jgi:3-hydroxyacyl-[acyl-carrier-protein] dehydratase
MQCTVTSDHPSLPGHFPGHPVVPGVVILNYALEHLNRQLQPLSVIGIRRLKFLAMLRPGDTFRVEATPPQNGRMGFKCFVREDLLAEGQVAVG